MLTILLILLVDAADFSLN